MLLLRPPGVYRPQGDTELLTETLRQAGAPPGARVLDVCTGTGAIAVEAARMAALRGVTGRVSAVDLSARAVAAARLNARMRGLLVKVVRGDLLGPFQGQRFDVIVSNPPYVPAFGGPPSRHGAERAWDAGTDGRTLLDRICAHAPDHLAPGGMLMIVQSALSGVEPTLAALRARGLKAAVAARRLEPFGPVMHGRARELEARGLIEPGQRHEELVVIRADRAC